MVRDAKSRGLAVTCEVTPHHIFLSEEDLLDYDTNLKMNPPLRAQEDVAAIRTALADGTIDAIATDHAPHAPHEKELEFELAPFGTIGLETALPLVATRLVASGDLDWADVARLLCHGPRAALGLPGLTLTEGATADLTVFDPEPRWTVEAAGFASRSQNSAFLGKGLNGRARHVVVAGRAVVTDGRTD
jgi:dihydroorotase